MCRLPSKDKVSQVQVAWPGCLGTGPAKQPQPDRDTGVSRCHMTVTGRSVMTRAAVSRALTLTP